MSSPHIGILLSSYFDVVIDTSRNSNGLISGLIIGSTINQEAAIVLKSQQGDIKEDPLLGVALTKFVRGKYNVSQIEQRIRTNLTRVDINYDDYKDSIITAIKTSE